MQRDPFTRVGSDAQGWFRNATARATEVFGNAYEHSFNTGMLFLRATAATTEFLLDWHNTVR